MHTPRHFFACTRKTLLGLWFGGCAALFASASYADDLIVRIGHVAPTSGQLKHLGKDNENGAQLAIEDLNRRNLMIAGKRARFELISKDDEASPEKAKIVARELVAAKVAGVVGHLNSGTSIPAAAIYAQANIPQISPSATNPRLTSLGYKTVFRTIANDSYSGMGLAAWAMQQPIEPIFFVVDDRTAYGAGVADTFVAQLKAYDGVVVNRGYTDNRASKFDAIIEMMKGSTAKWVFYGGMDQQAGLLLKQMRAANINLRMLGSDGICTNEIAKVNDGNLQYGDVVCTEPGAIEREFGADYKEFKQRFTQRFGIPVQLYAPYTYDCVNILAEAMVAADSIDPAVYLPKLAATKHHGKIGQIRFDTNGDIVSGYLTFHTFRGLRKLILSKGRIPEL